MQEMSKKRYCSFYFLFDEWKSFAIKVSTDFYFAFVINEGDLSSSLYRRLGFQSARGSGLVKETWYETRDVGPETATQCPCFFSSCMLTKCTAAKAFVTSFKV
jgi:hypothetical protein